MKNFNDRGGFKPRGGGFGRPSFGGNGGRDRGPVTMHKAICAECGNSCEVPFRPNGEKPVYCSNCFGSKREGGNDRAPRRDFGARPSFSKPSFERSYENRENRENRGGSFAGNTSNNSGDNEAVKRQLESINNKLDQLIRAMKPVEEYFPIPKLH